MSDPHDPDQPHDDSEPDDGDDPETDEIELVFIPMNPIFHLHGDRYAVRLPDWVLEETTRQLDELRSLLMSEPDNPNLVRLFPTVYTTDAEAEAEYQRLMRTELITSRLAAFDTVEQTMQKDNVSGADLHQWLQALNALRLVLAVIIGIDSDEFELEQTDPMAPTYALYLLFTQLTYDIIAALRVGGVVDR